MINDFPWEAQPFDFFKEMLTSFIWHQEKRNLFTKKKIGSTNNKFIYEEANLKLNIY